MNGIWIITCVFVALACELLAAHLGLPLPAVGVCAFYLLTVFRWERTLLPLAIAAGALDVTFGRGTFVSVLLLLPTAVLADLWRRHGDRREIAIQTLPGLLLGTAWGMGVLVLESLFQEHLTFALLRHNLWLLVQYVALSAVTLPVAVFVLDGVSRRIELPRYAAAKYSGGLHHAS